MLELNISLPKYAAAEKLSQGLIEYMVQADMNPGETFPSDRDIMKAIGRGRYSVRQALKLLQDKGLIERRGGIGTFVGQRIVDYKNIKKRPIVSDQQSSSHKIDTKEKKLLKVAVIMGGITDAQGSRERRLNHWYYDNILQELSYYSLEENYTVEIMSEINADSELVRQRFQVSSPDLLVCIGPAINYMTTIGEAIRQGIIVVILVVRSLEYGLINIYEDSRNACQEAIHYLTERGHHRIVFFQILSQSGWWSIDRFEYYREALELEGADQDESLALWLPLQTKNITEIVRHYLKRAQPTAVLCGSYHSSQLVSRVDRFGRIINSARSFAHCF